MKIERREPPSTHISAAHAWDNQYDGAEFSPVYEPLWQMLRSFLANVPAISILEFGCGDGTYACLMGETGHMVTGIDISERAIDKATSRRCNNCTFINHDSIPNQLPSESYDAVVMLNSLHCLTHDDRTILISQAKRVLKRNGYFFASVLSLEDESYPRQEWKEIERSTFDDGTGKLFHFFSPAELTEEFSGLKIIETRILQNIHPACGRKSALFVVTARNN